MENLPLKPKTLTHKAKVLSTVDSAKTERKVTRESMKSEIKAKKNTESHWMQIMRLIRQQTVETDKTKKT